MMQPRGEGRSGVEGKALVRVSLRDVSASLCSNFKAHSFFCLQLLYFAVLCSHSLCILLNPLPSLFFSMSAPDQSAVLPPTGK